MAFTTDISRVPHPNLLTGLVSEIEILEWHAFHENLSRQMASGSRLVGFFGSPGSEETRIFLNAVLSDDARGSLNIVRAGVDKQGHFPSLTAERNQFQCFEREIFEQYGVRPIDHPWLKPIRFSNQNAGTLEQYPFYQLEGKEVHEVGVGPIHAGVIEPGHFRFMCLGERVHHLEIQLGYQHRGVEALLLTCEPSRLAPLIETIAGDSSIAHVWAYCMAWEALAGASASFEMDLARGIALELERVAMHLAGLSGMAADIGFLPGGSTYGRLRTAAINASMRICGSRFGRGWLRPGEVRGFVEPGVLVELEKSIRLIQHDLREINGLFLSAKTVQKRFKRIGSLSREEAIEMGFVGMAARSAGVFLDLRSQFSGRLYSSVPLPTVVEKSGDCWARANLRIREMDESLRWIISAGKRLGEVPTIAHGTIPFQVELKTPRAEAFAVSLIEGWRGEVMHYIETQSDGRLRHYKVQDPSFRNWFALALALRNQEISDFPICNKSFDLSYCGQDL